MVIGEEEDREGGRYGRKMVLGEEEGKGEEEDREGGR